MGKKLGYGAAAERWRKRRAHVTACAQVARRDLRDLIIDAEDRGIDVPDTVRDLCTAAWACAAAGDEMAAALKEANPTW